MPTHNFQAQFKRQILVANWKKIPRQFHWQRGFLGFDRSKLNAIAKAKKLFVSETGIRFCVIDSQISFLALAIASKKPSVKLVQCGRNLAQSLKLGV